MLRWLIGIILGKIICESSNWQHIQRLKITILGANWQLFRLERIAKCSYFILSTQNIKFHWIVMKIKKFMLPIWWNNRDLFPLRNKYNVVFILNGLSHLSSWCVLTSIILSKWPDKILKHDSKLNSLVLPSSYSSSPPSWATTPRQSNAVHSFLPWVVFWEPN